MKGCRVWCASRSAVTVFALAGVLGVLLPSPAAAQLSTTQQTDADTRARLYEELERDVAALRQQGNLLKKVVKLVKPMVVHIKAEKGSTNPAIFGGEGALVEEAGSGVIIQLKGKFYVLTNRHVIKNASDDNIDIKLADGRQIQPRKVWDNPDTDVAVMAVSAPGLTPARLGDSAEMEIGDFILAIGSPFGLSHSVTYGIISAKGRWGLKLGNDDVRIQDFMQTDAAINPGNSGGPLFNLSGEVVGINTAIASNSGGNEGIGFTIPINTVMLIANQLIERGEFVRAYLGVEMEPRFSPTMAVKLGLKRRRGALINGITRGSPAQAANLQVGDVILQYDGAGVENLDHLQNLVGLTPVGKQVPLIVFRDGETLSLSVTVGALSKIER